MYECMLEAARQSPINEKIKIKGFDQYLKPLLDTPKL